MITIQEFKERVPLRTVLEHYGHTGLPERNGKHFTCIFPENHANGDARPSCNFTTGKDGFPRYHCFSCGASGDQFDFVEIREGVNTTEAKKIVAGIGGIEEGGTYTAPRKPVARITFPEKPEPMVMPSDLRRGTEDEWRAVADLRKIDVHGVSLVARYDILFFGTHRGKDCWIITDKARIVAEARRMDGKPFPHSGKKPDTIKNGKKSWPVGIRTGHSDPELYRKIVVVEGGPDLLAAYHFSDMQKKMGILPVAILGRECREIHPEALPLFEGRDVRIMPHADPDGGGMDAAKRWAKQIAKAGALSVTAFDFSGLTRSDGKPVKDLNDCTEICKEDEPQLERLFQ